MGDFIMEADDDEFVLEEDDAVRPPSTLAHTQEEACSLCRSASLCVASLCARAQAAASGSALS
tara:strand:+ start:743 stop:931 length:189 start_codon:yes stop_codon:yes gene_type:complete